MDFSVGQKLVIEDTATRALGALELVPVEDGRGVPGAEGVVLGIMEVEGVTAMDMVPVPEVVIAGEVIAADIVGVSVGKAVSVMV